MAFDALIDVLRGAQIEAMLRLPAERVAGAPHPGNKGGKIGWRGPEEGTVCLRERKLQVKRPRLRKKGQGEADEVPVSANEAMRWAAAALLMTEQNSRKMMGYRDL